MTAKKKAKSKSSSGASSLGPGRPSHYKPMKKARGAHADASWSRASAAGSAASTTPNRDVLEKKLRHAIAMKQLSRCRRRMPPKGVKLPGAEGAVGADGQ